MNKELLLLWANKLDETPDLIQSPWVCGEFYFDIPEPTRILFNITPQGLLREHLDISEDSWKYLKDKLDNNKLIYKQAARLIRDKLELLRE